MNHNAIGTAAEMSSDDTSLLGTPRVSRWLQKATDQYLIGGVRLNKRVRVVQ